MSRALQHFTNRKGSIRRFAEYLHGAPRVQILYFHGDGGNGKSLLLRHLRQICARQVEADSWAYLQTLPDEDFRSQFEQAENAVAIPTALLDFADRRERVAFDACLSLRRQLAGKGLRFAVFDYACLLYLRNRNELTPERIKQMFPDQEIDFLKEVIEMISHAPVPGLGLGKAALGLFNKRLGERFTLYWQRRGIDEAELERLHALDPERELYDQLPLLLARDLNASLALPGAPSRVALFFDTHEAFWEVEERRRGGDKRFENDRWLRQLLLELDFAHGLVAVVAGRETPNWADAPLDTIPADFVEGYLVGCLRRHDAADYLTSVGVNDETLQAALLDYAEQEPGKVHPYYLGLCADVALAAQARNVTLTAAEFKGVPSLSQKGEILLGRLQRYVTDGVRDALAPLCACRSFDYELFKRLMSALDLNATKTDFDHLTEFSFVWQAETAGRYRLHDLMRRLAFERDDPETRRAHEALVVYYAERADAGDVTAVAARAYHLNRLEPDEGVKEWVAAMDEALRLSRYDTCRALLTVRNELILPDDFALGWVSQTEGKFYATLAQHELARDNYLEAIAAYGEALRRAPDDVAAHNNQGNALMRLGELQARLSQYEAAQASYGQAIAAYGEALRRAPDYVEAHNNQGNALLSLGELQARLKQHEAAQASYRQAIASYGEALRRAPDYVKAHNNQGKAFGRMAQLLASNGQTEPAKRALISMAESFAHSLRVAPNQPKVRELYEQSQAVLTQDDEADTSE